MRILFISNSTSVSGAPAALLNVVRELIKRHQIAVVMPDSTGPLYSALNGIGVKCYCEMPYGLTIWPRVLNPLKFIRRIWALTVGLDKASMYVGQVLDEFRPDIVHTNVGPLDIAYEQCRQRRIPHVWHLREFQYGMRFWPSRRRFMDRIHSYGNRNVAITRCVSEYWKLRDCDEVIYDGVRIEKGTEIRNDISRSGFLFVGRLEKNKGLIQLLKAYSQYRRNGGTERLMVVGLSSMPYGLRCRLYVSLHGLKHCVGFLGQRNDAQELMKKSLAVVVPSVTEGFGLVSVEAMANGCLVIGRNSTGMKEQFDIGEEYTGDRIGFRYRSCSELSALLSELSDYSDAYDDIRERALRTVTEKYSISRSADELEAYYSKILEDYR